MQASTTQRLADHRLAAMTLLAASTFAVGAALGGVAGLAAAPLAAPVAAPVAADTRTIDLSAHSLRLQRDGEIAVTTSPAVGSSALPRYEVKPGK